MQRPLIIGATVLFGLTGCGDTDYSEPDPGSSTSTTESNNGTTAGNNGSTGSNNGSTGSNNASTLLGMACSSPGDQICDDDRVTVLQCTGGSWREFIGSDEYGCECSSTAEVQCWAAGFVGIRSSKRPNPTG